MAANMTPFDPSAATLEMQLQVDDAYDMQEAAADVEPITEEDAVIEGTEADLVDTSAPSPVLHRSESVYDATTDFKSSRPLHCQLPPGTLINKRYKVEKIVGKGSFGCAYLCTDLMDGGEVSSSDMVGNLS